MKPSKLLSLAIVLLATGWVSLTAAEPITDELLEDSPVTVTVQSDVAPDQIKAGQTFEVTVNFDIQPGWHIYDSQLGLVGRPTSLLLLLPDGFSQEPAQWPPSKAIEESGVSFNGYDGQTSVKVLVRAPEKLDTSKPAVIGVTATWIACHDQCVPGQASISLLVLSGAGGNGGANGNGGVNGNVGGNGNGGANGNVGTVQAPAKMSFLAYLAFAFIGGALLNLMPCVLPVLAFKIMRFVKESNESRSKVFKLGLAYTGGTIATCMSLAAVVIVAQILGSSLGWGFQFQQPLFVLALATLVMVMSLGMFGVFMVQVSVGQGISKLSQSNGYAGAFFTGVLATVLSTPCTAPFLGTAVGFAFAEAWWVILLIFFTVGLGLAAPYLVLTSNPGWMKYIPKPGEWMERFKELMAFTMMGSVVWLLYIIGQQTGTEGLLATLIFLLAASVSSWLVGRFTMYETRPVRKYAIWGVALAIPAALFFWQVLPAFTPKAPQHSEQAWSQSAVDKALGEGKIVFVDFTAAYCLTCRVNESGVLESSEVQEAMKRLDVVFLKGDWSNGDPSITAELKKHKRSGVPLYLVFSPHRPADAVVLPEILTNSVVLEALEQASQR